MQCVLLLQLKFLIFDVITCLSSPRTSKLTNWSAASWLQLAKYCTTEDVGLNPIPAWVIFRLYFCNFISCNHNCYDLWCSTSLSCSSSSIHLLVFIIYRYTKRSQIDQFPAGLIAPPGLQRSWVWIPFKTDFFSRLTMFATVEVAFITWDDLSWSNYIPWCWVSQLYDTQKYQSHLQMYTPLQSVWEHILTCRKYHNKPSLELPT